MNYTRIYASIVLRAQSERTERLALKKQGQYFEDHHIIPRSLGGKDTIDNMALLTGREHYICHWLLTKIYPINTDEYSKMIFALWMMNSNPVENIQRYKNSRCYEWVRTRAARLIGIHNKISQSGNKNSQYGKHWYTNYETGECTSFIIPPDDKWIQGRNLFRGEYSKIKNCNNTDGHYTSNRINPAVEAIKQQKLLRAQSIWDDFHNGCYSGLRDYCRKNNLRIPTIARTLNKYIPMYKIVTKPKSHKFNSMPDLVGKYNIEGP
jgi:hypothetical protein